MTENTGNPEHELAYLRAEVEHLRRRLGAEGSSDRRLDDLEARLSAVTAQMIAGVMEVPRGNTFGFTAFMGYGAFWWSFALFIVFFHGKVPGAFVGWYLLLWGIFTFYMWLATFRSPRVLQLIFLALWITFLLLAAGDGLGMPTAGHLGGYMGLITAALAFYLSAADVINEAYGRTVLPTGAKA